MKKYLFLTATAALALASCNSEDYIGAEQERPQSESTAIAFGHVLKKTTRAEHTGADAAALLGNNFVVEGVRYKTEDNSQVEVFDHYNVNWANNTANTTESNSSNWEYVGFTPHVLSSASTQAIKFWNYDSKQYDFVAFSYGTSNATKLNLTEIKYANIGKAVDATGNTNAVYTVTGSAEELAKAYVADLVSLYNQSSVSEFGKDAVVTPKFRAMGTKVRLAFYETVPGYSVKNVKFYNVAWDESTATSDAGDNAATLFAENAVFPSATSKGTMSVYFPTVGFSKSDKNGSAADPDYNQAHIKFAAGTGTDEELVKTKGFGNLDYKANKESGEEDVKYLGRTSAEATYAGTAANNYYSIVLPLGTSDNLQIRIEYDLIPVDGSEDVIHVRDARAVVPAAYSEWKPNYAYTYIFKISDNTNGWTGVDGDGHVVEGLTPITFDAVVVDTEDGIQETVTTVAKPSITTYQEGVNATAISEYKPGEIYAAVMNGTTNVDLTTSNMAVYKATTTEPAITEAIVKDMLDGKKQNTGITLTSVGYNIVSSVPAADGNTLAVKAAKFNAQAGSTYVFMYTDGSQNYVKVIKVASEGVAGVAYNWQAAANSYTYTATVTATGGNEVTFTYAAGAVSADKHEILHDLARYLGAIYYAGGASAVTFNTVDYTWNPTAAGNLKGSNWYGGGQTLVKAVNTWYAANPTATELTLTIDGTATTLKFVQL